ncbi:uncharacterized protein LOC103953161 isoform X3 [Pyrus x bretschneideri]|uniref:uncharacterized protein LOC103953161 isoform X3 n=1 Tax=Pyrus x bretschneideri TaxID=225117 RepID=UPI0020301786|nr:uncharacterized protein LOC103953161 isoform X3 [Pyrus x bretschneideri]
MADSAQNESRTTPKRQVRRKLVQTTLFPLKPQQQLEVNGDLKAARGNAGDDDCGDDEDFCGSQSKTKRKSRGKKTPPIKAPKKDGKRSTNSTPKKKINGTEVESEDAPRVVTDLRLEARLKAEETSRIFSGMFSGKQIHPFFSICKAGKRKREETEVDVDLSYVGRKDKEITSGPIHVFERTQDDAVFLDWRNWTFCEDTFMKSGPDMECASSSIFEGSVECLNFDKLPIVFRPCKLSTFQNVVSLDQHCIQQEFAHDISPTVPGFLVDEQLMHYQQSTEAEDNEMLKVGLLSQHTTYIKKSDIEQQKILEERLMSNYSSCGNQPTNSLWTYKYRPMKAIDVCGNHESVNFLSEWLRLWYERDFRANKDLTRCSQSDSDLEGEDEEASMKKNNVLLVTGPTGSGKSAAIYACAQEQGFKVLELSASECRSGALVKQRFGEALKSHNFRRSVANPEGSQNKSIVKSPFVDANGMTDHEMDDDVIELIAVSDEDSHGATEASVKSVSKEDYSEVKHLILFDDVDITFLEDRGFIAAIQQIAKTAKGPIILTSNSDNPVLPDSLDRLQVRFMLPSQKELHSLAYMVSALERANIQPLLLERLIECCRGDIRKIFMHLQFWCQGGRFRKDTKMREWYGSLLFDVEAGHLMLPNMLPWDLPSQLSDVVEKEITKALYVMEESPRSMDVIEENLHEIEVQYSLDMPCNGMESLEAKKVEMLSRNGSVHDCYHHTAQTDTASEFSNDLGTPFSSCRHHVRNMQAVVMSDSEDEFMTNGYPIVTDNANDEVLGINPLSEELLIFGAANIDGPYECSELADEVHISETCNSVDISCVPESSFVPETEIDNMPELSSQTVSSDHFANAMKRVSLDDELHGGANNLNKQTFVQGNSDKWGSGCATIAEYSHKEFENQKEHAETVARAYQLMDECSRMDFSKGSQFIQGQKSSAVTDLVQDSWDKLRGSRIDLRQYIASEQPNASQIVMLADRTSNLISETDMLFSKCQSLMNDSFELSMIPLEESDVYSWCDERLLLASTIAQHGFCFYAKCISSVGSKESCVGRVDLAGEMLANTASTMAFSKLIGKGMRASKASSAERNSETSLPNATSEIQSRVFDVIRSIVPSRTYSNLRGGAQHEYLSSLRHISRSEASRLSEGAEKTTRSRRRRVAPHYLSRGALMLSPEHISLLDQYGSYGKTSSSY